MSAKEQTAVDQGGEQAVISNAAKLLGMTPSQSPKASRLQIHAFLKDGLKGRAVVELRERLTRLDWNKEFEEAVGIGVRSVQRYKSKPDHALTLEQSDRIWRVANVLARATTVLGTQEAAEDWLDKPARALEGKKPLELLATAPGTQLVADLLEQMDYGVYV